MNRLQQQIEFIKEIDKLKEIYRRSYLLSQTRNENSAEHCWHVSMMALLLSEHANFNINITRVIEMLLIHDIVEIDAGDTFCYDEAGNLDKEQREQKAADRIFAILPDDQADRLMKLWQEYENADTPEARFAIALDRLMPIIHNYSTSGKVWRENGITKDQVLNKNKKIGNGSSALWEFAKEQIFKAVEKGILKI